MTHAYVHPDSLGLGAHHADPGDPMLHERPAQPPEATEVVRRMMSSVGLTEEQNAKLEAFLSRTMHDLDMSHGTKVRHVGRDEERNLELVEWTDKNGDDRITSLTPEQFSTFFLEA